MKDVPEKGTCYHCGVELTAEYYCYGCEKFICDECPVYWSVADATPSRNHDPEDHVITVEDDYIDWDGTDEEL